MSHAQALTSLTTGERGYGGGGCISNEKKKNDEIKKKKGVIT
jgi:hypothetical protein